MNRLATKMNNALFRLMEKYRKGSKPAIHLEPFLPLVRIKQRGLSFNESMKYSQVMAEAALLSLELGFDSTVLPLKQPEKTRELLERLTEFIHKLIDDYVCAGVDFMLVIEVGGASISPETYSRLILPCMQDIFQAQED